MEMERKKNVETNLDDVATAKIDGFNKDALEDILMLEQKCFPIDWQYGEEAPEYYRKKLENPSNINIFLKVGKEVAGYILLVPHSDIFEEMNEYDPGYEKKENTYYIETIQVLPEKRGIGGAKKLLVAGCEEAKKRGVSDFSIHARTLNGLHEKVKKLFEGKIGVVRKIDKWQPAQGEPYEYIEWNF